MVRGVIFAPCAGRRARTMSTAEAVSYLQWKKDVEQHDYAAASSYLSIRFGESRAETGGGRAAEASGHHAPRQRHPAGHRARPAAAVRPGRAERPEEGAEPGKSCPRFSWRRAMSRTGTTGSPSPTRSILTRTSRSRSAHQPRSYRPIQREPRVLNSDSGEPPSVRLLDPHLAQPDGERHRVAAPPVDPLSFVELEALFADGQEVVRKQSAERRPVSARSPASSKARWSSRISSATLVIFPDWAGGACSRDMPHARTPHSWLWTLR